MFSIHNFIYSILITLISMSSNQSLKELLEKSVHVITSDGRVILGILKGFDQTINIILENSMERIYSLDEDVLETPLGLYLIRGDNM